MTEIVDKNPAHWLPHCYTRLGNTQLPVLQELAALIHPVALSLLQQAALKKKGEKSDVVALRAAKHIEWMIGFPLTQTILGDLRHTPTLKKMLRAMCHDDHRARGVNVNLLVNVNGPWVCVAC